MLKKITLTLILISLGLTFNACQTEEINSKKTISADANIKFTFRKGIENPLPDEMVSIRAAIIKGDEFYNETFAFDTTFFMSFDEFQTEISIEKQVPLTDITKEYLRTFKSYTLTNRHVGNAGGEYWDWRTHNNNTLEIITDIVDNSR